MKNQESAAPHSRARVQSQQNSGIFYGEKLKMQDARIHTQVRFYEHLQPLGKSQRNSCLAATGLRLLRTFWQGMALKTLLFHFFVG